MRAAGCAIDGIHATGGHARNPDLVALYATATATPILAHGHSDAVLRGAAIAATVAAGLHPDLATAARAMRREGRVVPPDPAGRARLDRDYRIQQEMRSQRARIAELSSAPDAPAA